MAGFACLTCPLHALAEGTLGPDGSNINTSAYYIDLFQGPVFAGTRATGLGGAFVALADDLDGDVQNPAAPGVRATFSYDYFDYWLGFGLAFPATFANDDFFNSGSGKTQLVDTRQTGLIFVTPAMNLQFGKLGIGITLEGQHYGLSAATSPTPSASSDFLIGHLQAAYPFFDGQLVMGAGLRVLAQRIRASAGNGPTQTLTSGEGIGGELGTVWRPNGKQFRFGLSLRSGVSANADPSEDAVQQGNDFLLPLPNRNFYMPYGITLPWDINVGFAYQFGRVFNPRWQSIPDRLVEKKSKMRAESLANIERWQTQLAALPMSASTFPERNRLETAIAREPARLEKAYEELESETRYALRRTHRETDRRYLLITTSLLITGASRDAVGVESFLQQIVMRSGEQVVYSPRLGLETEPWLRQMKVRMGTYIEPTRFATSEPRAHFTAGFDFKLLKWDVFGFWPRDYVWKLATSIDIARAYSMLGFSLAGWY